MLNRPVRTLARIDGSAAAVAAGGLHRAMLAEVGAAAPAAAEGAGYRLTPHVLRYYETTKA